MDLRQVLPRAIRAAVMLTCLLWTPALATTATTSDAELIRRSDLVVDARVRQLTPHWNEDRSLLFTSVELEVSRNLFSREPFTGRSLTIEVLGGELDGVGLFSPDAPTFHTEERVVVFVRKWSAGRLSVAGGPSGVLRVDPSGLVLNRSVSVDQLGSRLRDLAR